MDEELLKRNTDCIYLSPSPLASQKPPSYGNASIGWAQYPISDDQCDSFSLFEQQPPLKRTRSSEENFLNSTPLSSIIHPPGALMNKGMNNIFFKTRICVKFKAGMCRNGENCNFAHGMEDMRQPPSNWQEIVGRDDDQSTGGWNDDQKIIQKMKICRKFYNGEECPYGERCNFLHEDPAKFRDDSGRFRESSAISIGTTGTPLMNGSSSVYSEEKTADGSSLDPFRSNAKPSYWKTKLCTKWEITGHCPFGEKCHFAHGQAELAAIGGSDGEVINSVSISTKPQVTQAMNQTLCKVGNFGGQKDETCLLKWKGTKKINRIYADWLDDMPLGNNYMKPELS